MRIWAVLKDTTPVSDIKQFYVANLVSLNGSIALLKAIKHGKCVVCNESFILRIEFSDGRLNHISWQAEREAEMIYCFHHSDHLTVFVIDTLPRVMTYSDICGENRNTFPLCDIKLGSLPRYLGNVYLSTWSLSTCRPAWIEISGLY